MPVDWRPDKPIQVFIEENRHSSQKKEEKRYQGRIFNDKCQFQERIIRNNQRDIHELEGLLEVQRQLLLKLAEQENRVMETHEKGTPSSESLQSLKADTVQAIQKTWSPRSRSTAHQRSLFQLK
jgi:hypothetical protein